MNVGTFYTVVIKAISEEWSQQATCEQEISKCFDGKHKKEVARHIQDYDMEMEQKDTNRNLSWRNQIEP